MIGQASPSWLELLADYGVLGIVVLAAAFGWITFKPAVDDLRRQIVDLRSDLREAREDLRRSNQVAQEVLLPVATKTLEAINRFQDQLYQNRKAS